MKKMNRLMSLIVVTILVVTGCNTLPDPPESLPTPTKTEARGLNPPEMYGLPSGSSYDCNWNSTTEKWSCEFTVNCEDPETPEDDNEDESSFEFNPNDWILVWHGRAGQDEATGYNGEYVVAYHKEYFLKPEDGNTLQWWTQDALWLNKESKPPKDEWGNDSLKMLGLPLPNSDGYSWRGRNGSWDEVEYFAKVSWMRNLDSAWEVCEHDEFANDPNEQGCNGDTWELGMAEEPPPIPILTMIDLDALEEELESLPDFVRQEVKIVVIDWQETKALGL